MATHYSLEKSYTLSIGDSLSSINEIDVIKQLLRDTRSDGTRRSYEKDLRDFFRFTTNKEPNRDTVLEFLHLNQGQAVLLVLNFKGYLMNERKLAENTVNRKLAAIRSMVAMGRRLGVCAFVLSDVKSEIVQKYRDTSGIEASEYAKLLNLIDR